MQHEPMQFSSLPTEIRLMIWRQAVISETLPRVHSIIRAKRDASIFISNQPVSPLLHICHESRALYLSSTKTTYIYGTYMNLDLDTLYLVDCPTPKESGRYSDGFEACKELGRNADLVGKVKRLAVKDSFWLRPNTITRSIAVDAWNMVIKGNMHALEELLVVFEDSREGEEQRGRVGFEFVGSYHTAPEGVVGERERRCDEFLHMYLGYFPAEGRWRRPVIKYMIIAGGNGEKSSPAVC